MMIFIEHIAYRWAEGIEVERKGDSLLLKGQRPAKLEVGKDSRPGDVLLAYSRFAQRSKPIAGQLRGGRLAPHVQFANAETDKDLIEFVHKYGPVNGSRSPRPLAKDRTRIEVLESLQCLRRERVFFASALALKAALKTDIEGDIAKALVSMIHACSLPGPLEEQAFELRWFEELFLRSKHDGLRGKPLDLERFICSLGGKRIREYGRYALCLILNSFPPIIVPVEGGLVELPPNEKAGILPALLFWLRRDWLDEHEIRMCAQRDCGKWFKVERGGQRFCSPECSQYQRQREYWERAGKKLRAARLASKPEKKGGKQRGSIPTPRQKDMVV
jgi:hypothetical protein